MGLLPPPPPPRRGTAGQGACEYCGRISRDRDRCSGCGAPTAVQPLHSAREGFSSGLDGGRLAGDVSRCDGVGSRDEGWREGCETCLRRTAPRDGRVRVIAPPAIIVFECELAIPPNARRSATPEDPR